MLDQIQGLHHVTAMASDARVNNRFFTDTLGLRRVIDRDYFWAIYFRTPGGGLFEVETNEPGFDRGEDRAHLGEVLKLPTQHRHPIEDTP